MKIFPPGNSAVISTAAYSHLDDLFTVKLAWLWNCVDERTQLSDILVLSGSRICGTGNLPCNLVRVHTLCVPCVSLHSTVCALCQLTQHCIYPVSSDTTLYLPCGSLHNTVFALCHLTQHCICPVSAYTTLYLPCVSLHNTVFAMWQLTKHRMCPVAAYETFCMYPVSAYKTLHVLCVSLQNTLHVPRELTKHFMFLHISTF